MVQSKNQERQALVELKLRYGLDPERGNTEQGITTVTSADFRTRTIVYRSTAQYRIHFSATRKVERIEWLV